MALTPKNAPDKLIDDLFEGVEQVEFPPRRRAADALRDDKRFLRGFLLGYLIFLIVFAWMASYDPTETPAASAPVRSADALGHGAVPADPADNP